MQAMRKSNKLLRRKKQLALSLPTCLPLAGL